MGLFSSKPGGTFFGNLLRVGVKKEPMAIGGVEVSGGGILSWLSSFFKF